MCQPYSSFKIIWPVIKLFLGQRVLKRVRMHFGSTDNVLAGLAKCGLTANVLPYEVGGTAAFSHEDWLRDRRRLEGDDLVISNPRLSSSHHTISGSFIQNSMGQSLMKRKAKRGGSKTSSVFGRDGWSESVPSLVAPDSQDESSCDDETTVKSEIHTLQTEHSTTFARAFCKRTDDWTDLFTKGALFVTISFMLSLVLETPLPLLWVVNFLMLRGILYYSSKWIAFFLQHD